MKLVFPGGEHPQVLLGPGVNRIGSAPEANVVLDRPGVKPQHCLMHVSGHGVMLEVPTDTAVTVNGRRVDGLISLRPGDTVVFDSVLARLTSMEPAAPVQQLHAATGHLAVSANDDPGATAVRQVLPRYVLRGVSGSVFGRSFPLAGTTTVGRAQDCDIHLEEAGISRLHARLLPTDDGVLLEDAGSANGTSVNDKRILRAELRAGDEIAFDTLRFRLMGPGMPESQSADAGESTLDPRRVSPWLWVGLAAAGLIAIWTVALLR